MKALICDRPGVFRYVEKEAPSLGNDEILLKIKRVGICGTDLHAFEGTQPFFTYPRILGHELAGEVAAVNGADSFLENEAVTIIPYLHCDKCRACKNGLTNCCVKLRVCGVHIDGGMAEYYVVPSWTLIHGDSLSLDELALVEPLSIGYHGVRRGRVNERDKVLVVGAGPIGLGIVAFSKLAGAEVTVLDLNNKRLDFCKKHLNVQNIINPGDKHIHEKMLEITGGDMFTAVFDATGNQKAINSAFNYMGHGASYILVGLQMGDITFSHPEFHKREASLMSSRNATRADFEYVIRSLKDKLIDPGIFITHRVKFDQVGEKFQSWLKPETGVIKAIVEMPAK